MAHYEGTGEEILY